ncbi:MAG TPA: hypothetical protein VK989_15095 [Polyangia bacterium]|jgi:hypothetical protein|nr:hypothetical protein [Polyangia bacterium]
MDHVEEREFTLRLQVKCAFPEDYDGDADGYAWWEEFPAVANEIVAAARRAAVARGWTVRPANRGRPADEEITLVVERTVSPPP